ncbi:MAG: hypothetical protein J0M33_16090 [Anaerolineae bacterium]|nr:hypothetical protein [Anaerolineae bacterium]
MQTTSSTTSQTHTCRIDCPAQQLCKRRRSAQQPLPPVVAEFAPRPGLMTLIRA